MSSSPIERRNHLESLASTLGLEVKIPGYDSYSLSFHGTYIFCKKDSPDVNNVCYGVIAAEQWLRGYQFCVASNDVKGYEEGPYKWTEPLKDSDCTQESQIDPSV